MKSKMNLLLRSLKMSKKHKNCHSATSPTADSTSLPTTTSGIRNLGDTLTPHKYNATFIRAGHSGRVRNALLIMLRDDSDHVLCDHIWVKWCNAFARMSPGDIISFTATPYRYIKGYSGDKHATSDFAVDVSLKDIRQVRVVGHNPVIKNA